jgi:hypothetical protein
MQLRVVVVYPGCDEVRVVGENAPESITIREARSFDRFAAELAAALGTAVRVDESPYLPVPENGMLFVCSQDVLDRSAIYHADRIHRLHSRTVLAEVLPGREVEACERLGLAAAVGIDRYFQWQHGSKAPSATGIIGLRRVAEIIGAQCSHIAVMSGQNYALMTHPAARVLTDLLARYLSAYATLV